MSDEAAFQVFRSKVIAGNTIVRAHTQLTDCSSGPLKRYLIMKIAAVLNTLKQKEVLCC